MPQALIGLWILPASELTEGACFAYGIRFPKGCFTRCSFCLTRGLTESGVILIEGSADVSMYVLLQSLIEPGTGIEST